MVWYRMWWFVWDGMGCVGMWVVGNKLVSENIIGVVLVEPGGWSVAAGRVSGPVREILNIMILFYPHIWLMLPGYVLPLQASLVQQTSRLNSQSSKGQR